MSDVRPGRVVIVGGCGFIGSRLANALAARGADVTVADIAPPPADLDSRCRVEERDVRRAAGLRGVARGAEAVFALAAKLKKTCEEDPACGWQTNVLGMANLLDEVIASGSRPRVVFTSSGGVYDPDGTVFPTPESGALRAIGLYAASKLAGEGMVAASAAAGGFSAVIFRPFTVFGAGPAAGERGHFIAHWLELAAAGRPLTLHGDGCGTVDLTCVDDAVRALEMAARAPIPPRQCRTYNLGGGTETPVAEVARWMREADPSITVTHTAAPHQSPSRQSADMRRIREELGYEPAVHPRDEIRRLVEARLGGAGR
ncbi:MAG TPA: NAD(P)-dependent oxidoreductase [Longimicrobium sp.]